MRPVRKKEVGEAINLFDDVADIPTKMHIVQNEYKPYGNARKVLLANLGNYCSYCEAYVPNGALLQTEHVQPKELYNHLEFKWSNFLLGCATCNGKGNKGSNDVVLGDVHLPHLNNTFLSLEYKEAGVVIVNPNLTGISKKHAEELIRLIGLDKPSSETDLRCDMRRRIWDMAQEYLVKYKAGEYKLNTMKKNIKGRSCWSIWYTVFKGYDEVRKALLEFPGTAKDCFDDTNHYEPIERNPGKADPV